MTTQSSNQPTLLICSVGGTEEPVVAAIRHWRPARILFLCSAETRSSVDRILAAASSAGGPAISPGCVDQLTLNDPQDLSRTLHDMRPLDANVRSWQQRGDDYTAVVDFTGGTKVMSAALALIASRWKCTFAYVGGQERSKGGVGIVLTGSERPISHANPWDALGYRAIEEAVIVFNNGGHGAASQLLEQVLRNVGRPDTKRELATLKAVVDGYAAWDRFDHEEAAKRFDDALKNRNDLAAIFPSDSPSLLARLECHRDMTRALAAETRASMNWVADLLRNALRRVAEGRYDDAVARFYRAFEALAQVRLRDHHGITDTKSVDLTKLPEALRREWGGRARAGSVALGLQDAYRLLKELGDDLGRQFADSALDDMEKSPLVARNQSILAHGFQPVRKAVCDQLCEHLRRLAEPAGGGPPLDDWRLPVPR